MVVLIVLFNALQNNFVVPFFSKTLETGRPDGFVKPDGFVTPLTGRQFF